MAGFAVASRPRAILPFSLDIGVNRLRRYAIDVAQQITNDEVNRPGSDAFVVKGNARNRRVASLHHADIRIA